MGFPHPQIIGRYGFSQLSVAFCRGFSLTSVNRLDACSHAAERSAAAGDGFQIVHADRTARLFVVSLDSHLNAQFDDTARRQLEIFGRAAGVPRKGDKNPVLPQGHPAFDRRFDRPT
jgi:hypothetical protein